MTTVRSLSVLMPTYQGAAFLERVLGSLARQRLEIPWDVRVIDSGSDDGTWEILGHHAERFCVPFVRERIHAVEFDHGDTRNLLAARSTGELCVFLTQDAIPIGEDFLSRLVANFADPEVGAAYARNVPRPDAHPLTKLLSRDDPGYVSERREVRLPDPEVYAAMNAHERRLLYNFNDVASAIRRELWERHPFPRTWFGEDVLMARALLEGGYSVVYDAEAQVEHSHDYDVRETFERAKIDGRFNAEWLDRICVASKSDARSLTDRLAAFDGRLLEEADLSEEQSLARELREAAFKGLYEGGRTKTRQPATRMLETPRLSILYVVHGFPPDTWAGTEVYTQNLALEMQRRGHRVTVLTRAPADAGGAPDFTIREDEFQGLRVLRMTHRLEHKNLRESYQNTEAEAAFRKVLLKERPDLVHFQHLIHTSAGLVHVARAFGLPTVLTCHDYWAICSRVQLIRPDGERCQENMGSGCFLCVKETGYKQIPRLKRLDKVAGGVLDKLAGGLRRTGSRSARRWEGFADMRARHAYVTEAYAAADLRISPSRFLRDKLVETTGMDPHRFLYSDNGMRTDHVAALSKKPDPEGRVRFGFVGSLVWYKGDEVMVRAMRRLAGEACVLNVYGSFDPEGDPHHAELERLAAESSPRNVFFKGRFDNARLSEVYAEIDVLVVPSIWFENSPITIHEAYLTHTPVLASDIGGMAEFVRDGVDGVHFKVGDDADLSAKMRRFLEQPDLIERLSQDWMQVKTIAENAAETEFRYRSLCTFAREVPAALTLLEYAGADTVERHGPAEDQAGGTLLLRPGGSAEYDLTGAGGGKREIDIQQLALGAEETVVLGGRVLIDGGLVAELEPFSARGKDEQRDQVVRLEILPEARRLRLEVSPEGPHARIRRVRVRRSEPEG